MAKRGKKPEGKVEKHELAVKTPKASKASKATGTESKELNRHLVTQVWASLSCPADMTRSTQLEAGKAALAALEGIGPQDELEGQLAAQMVATHNAAMECLRRAMLPEQTTAGLDISLKHAAKLLAVYCRQLETLDKHRGKGQQKVTVEHVHVHDGGQAVVGTVETSQKTESQKKASAKNGAAVEPVPALENKPGLVMPDVGLNTTSKVNVPQKARCKNGK